MNVKFKDNGDHFIITRPKTSVNNIIVGTMYIDTVGKMEIQNLRTGDNLVITFKSAHGSGIFSWKDAYEVKGKINDEHLVFGKWNKGVSIKKRGEEEVELFWTPEHADNWEQVYMFSPFTL